MFRMITAVTALVVLAACDSEGIDRLPTATSGDTQTVTDSTTVTSPVDGQSGASDGSVSGDSTDASGSTIDISTIPDDAASGSSDGGESSTVDTTAIPDDAASGSSDGGESSTVDATAIPDDAASGSSDGGESIGDVSSSTLNGSFVIEEAPATITIDSPPVTVTGDRDTNAGSFASDNSGGGSLLRRSTLTAAAQTEVCTSFSDQNNFSDTRVGDFILHNNAWNAFRAFPDYDWQQCISTNSNGALVSWNYDWGPGNPNSSGNSSGNASGDFFVRSYPELIYGVKDEFRTSAPKSVTGLPVELSELPNIQIDYSYDGPQFGDPRVVNASNNPRFPNGSTISGERNVAVETFMYEADAAGECSEGIVTRNGGSNHQFEVMLWLDAGAERLPAGPSDFVADLTIRGDAYKVYTKGGDPRYIAFVAQNPQSSGTIFWNDFIDWARENAHQVSERFGARSNAVQIQDDWCVANILVGTEIFWGAGNIDLFDWTITQTQ